jgi:hypothetical protein
MADVPCERKDQLHHIESHYIRNNNCVNKYIPNRTQQEYYQDNQEQRNQRSKKWNHDHKEKVNAKAIKYYYKHKERLQQKHICSCGGKYTTGGKSLHFHSIKHQQYINNKIEQQYQYCVELFESTQYLPFENQLVKF